MQNLLYRAKDLADLRGFAAHRDSVAAADSLDAAEAWYWLGVSHERAGRRDDAIAGDTAHAVRADPEDAILGLADLLLLRRDARRRRRGRAGLLEPLRERFASDRTPRGASVRLRAAWAAAVAGDADAGCRAVPERPRTC